MNKEQNYVWGIVPTIVIVMIFGTGFYHPPVLYASDSVKVMNQYGAPPAVHTGKAENSGGGETESEVWKNFKTSFALPLGDFAKKKSWLDGFSGNITFWYPLSRLGNSDQPLVPGAAGTTQGPPPADMMLYGSLYYFPVGYWFVNISLFQYINRAQSLPWQPDFSYSFGYSDWHPYTLSLIYGNYGGNKFAPDKTRGEHFTRFEEGTWSLGWKFPTPTFLERIVALHSSSGMGHQVNLNLTPSYFNVETADFRSWKTSLSLQTRYTVYEYFYLLCTLYYYPDGKQQQWWDPDFTYGIGYYDWHSGTISVQYNNYSGNRFPWRTPVAGTGRLLDGILTISWNFTF